jgi:hypothetical protein
MGVIFIVSGLFLLSSFGFLIEIYSKHHCTGSTYFVLITIVLSGIFSFIYGIVYLSRHFEDVQILAKYVNHDKTIITSEGDKLQEVTLEINGKTYTFTLTSDEE